MHVRAVGVFCCFPISVGELQCIPFVSDLQIMYKAVSGYVKVYTALASFPESLPLYFRSPNISRDLVISLQIFEKRE